MNPSIKRQQPNLCGPADTALGTSLFMVLAIIPLSLGGWFSIAASALSLAMLAHDRSKAGTKPITAPKALPAAPSQPKPTTPRIKPVATRTKISTTVSGVRGDIFKTLPIGSLLNCPYVMIVGGSRSGKTTLATALSMVRQRRGDTVSYATMDSDLPTCVDWDGVAVGGDSYQAMIEEFVTDMAGAAVGALRGQSYQFDELLHAASEGVQLTPLVTTLLTRGPKSGATCTIVTHTDTISSHGLGPGLSEALIRDRVLIEAIRDRLPNGEYAPSGRYSVTFPGEVPTTWEWPLWAREYPGGPLAALQSQLSRR